MGELAIQTTRLVLRPLPSAAAGALRDDRETAARLLGVALPPEWPQADLLDDLPLQAAAAGGDERFGVWVMIERESTTVVGDIGLWDRRERTAASRSVTASSPIGVVVATQPRQPASSSIGRSRSQESARSSPVATS